MSTLEELKRQNQKLRNELKSREEINALGRERNRLLQEQKILLRQKRFGGLLKFSKKASKTGEVVGRGSAKIGKVLGRGLLKIAQNIAEAERREEMLRRKSRRSPAKRSVLKSRRSTTRKALGKDLLKIAQNIAEAERKEEMLRRKSRRSPVKKSSTKRAKSKVSRTSKRKKWFCRRLGTSIQKIK